MSSLNMPVSTELSERRMRFRMQFRHCFHHAGPLLCDHWDITVQQGMPTGDKVQNAMSLIT